MTQLSIIIPSYNQGTYVGTAIRSALEQPVGDVDVIVVDGGSTDDTVDVLKGFGQRIRWVSEKDKGQADALNKGLQMARGRIVGWINSDDFYEPGIFGDVLKAFEDSSVRWVIGNISTFYEQLGKRVRHRSPVISYKTLRRNPDIVRQQGAFFRKECLQDAGGWDCDFHLALDYDLWTRLAKRTSPTMVDRYWGCYRIQPGQKTSGVTIVRQLREIDVILKREGVLHITRVAIRTRKTIHFAKHLIKSLFVKLGLLDKRYEHLSYSIRNL